MSDMSLPFLRQQVILMLKAIPPQLFTSSVWFMDIYIYHKISSKITSPVELENTRSNINIAFAVFWNNCLALDTLIFHYEVR